MDRWPSLFSINITHKQVTYLVGPQMNFLDDSLHSRAYFVVAARFFFLFTTVHMEIKDVTGFSQEKRYALCSRNKRVRGFVAFEEHFKNVILLGDDDDTSPCQYGWGAGIGLQNNKL